jgi:hypothetical protein
MFANLDGMSCDEMFKGLLGIADKNAKDLFITSMHTKIFYKAKDSIEKNLWDHGGMMSGLIRDSYTKNFSWPFITIDLVFNIAVFLSNKKCLSVMSGNGLLEYFISREGRDIIATDLNGIQRVNNLSCLKCNYEKTMLKDGGGFGFEKDFDVIECDAIKAVRTYDKEVLLMSWPNYRKQIGAETLKFALQLGFRYIIYIGEGKDGCCATDEFFDTLLKMTKEIKSIEMLNFWGIHDFCTIYESTVPQKTTTVEFRSPLLNKKIYSFVQNNSSQNNKSLKKLVKKYFDVTLHKKQINFLRTSK